MCVCVRACIKDTPPTSHMHMYQRENTSRNPNASRDPSTISGSSDQS